MPSDEGSPATTVTLRSALVLSGGPMCHIYLPLTSYLCRHGPSAMIRQRHRGPSAPERPTTIPPSAFRCSAGKGCVAAVQPRTHGQASIPPLASRRVLQPLEPCSMVLPRHGKRPLTGYHRASQPPGTKPVHITSSAATRGARPCWSRRAHAAQQTPARPHVRRLTKACPREARCSCKRGRCTRRRTSNAVLPL